MQIRNSKPINSNYLTLWEIVLGYLLVLPMYRWGIPWLLDRLWVGPVYQLFPWMFDTQGTRISWWNLLYYVLLTVLLLVCFFRFFAKEWRLFIKNLRFCLSDLPVMVCIAMAANVIGSLVVYYLVTSQTNPNQQGINMAMEAAKLPTMLTAIVFGPICEEILYRGLIFRSLRAYNIPVAHIVSASLFAIVHLLDEILAGDLSLVPMVLPYLLMGFALTYIYEKKHTLMVPILVHMCTNLLASIS